MKIAFLIYDSRSGSTILSKMLAERYGAVHITPEIGFEYLFSHPQEAGDLSAAFLMKKEYFINIGLTGEELAVALRGVEPGAGARGVLEAILGAQSGKAGGGGVGTVIVKNGRHTLFMKEIHDLLGDDARFIFIHRDPRAVINSKLRTIRPRNRYESMAWGGSLLAAYQWLRYSRRVRVAAGAGMNIVEVGYEDLMRSTRDELDRVAGFLGLPPRREAPSANGSVSGKGGAPAAGAREYEIPEQERSIHSLVMSGWMHQDRIGGWRRELSKRDQLVIEAVLHREMQRRGYTPDGQMSSLWRIAIIARALPGAALRIVTHYLRAFVYGFLRRGQ